jgi:hypothetical protein
MQVQPGGAEEAGMRRLVVVMLSTLATGAGPLPAAADTCTRADFEAVVGEAAEALRKLNSENKPGFQARLRQLKAKRGWSHDQFLAAAAPLVQDEKISGFDTRSSAFLARIEQLGQEGARAAQPDCGRLAEVRQSMQDLVVVQKQKWGYMFAKVDAELAK